MPDPIILSEKPLMGVLVDDYLETQKMGHITFGKTVEGLHIARMTQNGHQFVATDPDQMKAMSKVQQAVENAEQRGETALPASMQRK